MKSRPMKNHSEGTLQHLHEKVNLLEQSNRELERKSTFFETLMRGIPGLFYVFDDKFHVHLWNKNVETTTGYDAEEIPERNIFELFEGDDLPHMRQAIQNVFNTGEGVAEAMLVTKKGERVPHLFTGVRAIIEGTPYLLGIGLDISKRKLAENSLRESEALYRIFAERMTEGVLLFHRGTIQFANNAFSTILGYDEPNQLMGLDIMEFVHKDFEMYFKDLFDSLESGMSTERFFQARWIRTVSYTHLTLPTKRIV